MRLPKLVPLQLGVLSACLYRYTVRAQPRRRHAFEIAGGHSYHSLATVYLHIVSTMRAPCENLLGHTNFSKREPFKSDVCVVVMKIVCSPFNTPLREQNGIGLQPAGVCRLSPPRRFAERGLVPFKPLYRNEHTLLAELVTANAVSFPHLARFFLCG